MEKARQLLSSLVQKKHIYFTRRGNESIKLALEIAGKKKVLLQDQGGWMTYEPLARKTGYDISWLETDYGLVDHVHDTEVLLINSMPGYTALQDMGRVSLDCSKQNVFLINDVSGSIGTKEATHGDLIIGSFGRWKPLCLQGGGFIASDVPLRIAESELNFPRLVELLESLKRRRSVILRRSHELKKKLTDFSIVHREKDGYNVIALYTDQQEKEKLIKSAGVEFTLCPRYIRVMTQAVSFELKRQFNEV